MTSADELQTFMAHREPELTLEVTRITQHLLLVATAEGVDNMAALIDEVRNAKARTVAYLWRQIAALRKPPEAPRFPINGN